MWFMIHIRQVTIPKHTYGVIPQQSKIGYNEPKSNEIGKWPHGSIMLA